MAEQMSSTAEIFSRHLLNKALDSEPPEDVLSAAKTLFTALDGTASKVRVSVQKS